MSRVKVIYLLGWFRSGSTLLGNLLGQAPGVLHGGEIRSLFSNGVLLGRGCGCGCPVLDCPVWSPVLAAALPAGDRNAAAREVVAAQRAVLRLRGLPKLLRGPDASTSRYPEVRSLAKVMTAVYRTAAEVSGAGVVVDGSKRPADAALLRALPEVDPWFVHLVRDPRAVAFSETRRKRQLDPGGPAEMPMRSAGESVRGWLRTNLAADVLRARTPGRTLLLRYEDFAAAPRAVLHDLLRFAGADRELDFFTGEREAFTVPTHSVAGNADRFRTGRVLVRADSAWQAGLPRRSARLIAAGTFPVLARYGYPVAGRAPVAEAVRR